MIESVLVIAGKTRGPGHASRVRSPGAPRRSSPQLDPSRWTAPRRASGASGRGGWSEPRRSSAWSVPSGSRGPRDPTGSSALCGGIEMNPTLWMPRLRSIFPARGGDVDTRAAPLTCLECLSDLPPTGRFCPECGAVAPARLFSPPRAPCEAQGLDGAADTPDAADAAWLTGAPALPGLEASRFPSRRRPLRATAYGLAAATVVLIGVFSAVASLAPSLRASPSARAPAMDDEVERV